MKIYHFPSDAAEKRLQRIAGRGLGFRTKDIRLVQKIVESVRKDGDEALIRYSRQFDAPELQIGQLQVTSAEMAEASRGVDRRFKQALNLAAGQIEAFHSRQRPNSWIDTPRPGTLLGQHNYF